MKDLAKPSRTWRSPGERDRNAGATHTRRVCASCSRRHARSSRRRGCRRAPRPSRRAAQGRDASAERDGRASRVDRVRARADGRRRRQFSIRGGIFDMYWFGMAEPVRVEFWGDEIVELRHFDLASPALQSRGGSRSRASRRRSRSRGRWQRVRADFDRVALSARHAVRHSPAARTSSRNCSRTWDDAQHHIELARRRGEDVPDATSCSTPATSRSLRAFGAIGAIVAVGAGDERHRTLRFRFGPRSRSIATSSSSSVSSADGTPTIILCDNEGQAERLDELLSDDDRSGSPAALTIGVLDGGFVAARFPGLRVLTDHEIFRRERRIRRARRYITGDRLEPSRSSPATTWYISSTASASIAASRRSSSARARRSRRHRVRGRRSAERSAVSHRSDRALSLGS